MAARPGIVTAASIITIIIGGLSILSTLFSLALLDNPMIRQALQANPLPIPLQMTIAFTSSGLFVVCGILMLRRQGWARYLYLAWAAGNTVLTISTTPYSPMLILPGTALWVATGVMVFMPSARAWFRKEAPVQPA